MFLPKNRTSKLQPLDRDLFSVLKQYYRSSLMSFIISSTQAPGFSMNSITVPLAITWIANAKRDFQMKQFLDV